MKKQISIEIAKKIINNYADQITNYMNENNTLKKELDNTKTSLKINKTMLFKYLNSDLSKVQDQLLIDLEEENNRLNLKNDELYEDIKHLDKKLKSLQIEVENRFILEKSEAEKTNEELFTLNMKLDEKENIIYLLKKDIERLNSNKEKVYKEVFIVEPSKISMILNNELNFTRDILANISKIVILILMISITIIMVCALYKATIELIDNEQMDCNSISKNK